MTPIRMQELDPGAFQVYGRYASLTSPSGPALGDAPIRFFRDRLPLGRGEMLAASVTQVEPMPLEVDVMEYHTRTWEAFLIMDTDACICVAPATAAGDLDPATLEAFRVPAGTMVYLHPGVWHYAPYPLGGATLHSLVLLPERTYQNDCEKKTLAQKRLIEI